MPFLFVLTSISFPSSVAPFLQVPKRNLCARNREICLSIHYLETIAFALSGRWSLLCEEL